VRNFSFQRERNLAARERSPRTLACGCSIAGACATVFDARHNSCHGRGEDADAMKPSNGCAPDAREHTGGRLDAIGAFHAALRRAPPGSREPRANGAQDPPARGDAPDGSARFFLASVGRTLGGADISLADLVEHSADAVIFIDLANVIRYWNRGAEAMFQYPREETLGRKVGFLLPRDLLESDELGQIQQVLARDGSLSNYVTRRVRKDGAERWVSLTRSVLHDSRGAAIGSTAVFRDITEQRRTEEELFRARGLAVVGEISTNLAHEIKNRLAGIYAATQLLARSLAPGDPRLAVFHDVGQEIKKLDETAKDLLRFARPLPPKPVPTDVHAFLSRVIQTLERDADVRKHEIALDVEPDLVTNLDPDLMGQVFGNLVLNAAQAMERPGRIRLAARRDGARVCFEVADEGPGIPSDVVASLFRPFFTTKSQGTGLGLPITRKNVELHGGTIEVETELGKGTRFRIQLPIDARENPAVDAPVGPAASAARRPY
jgi:PAS domain S-box-containing protein